LVIASANTCAKLPKCGRFEQFWGLFTWQQRFESLALGIEYSRSPAKFAKRFESSNPDSWIRLTTISEPLSILYKKDLNRIRVSKLANSTKKIRKKPSSKILYTTLTICQKSPKFAKFQAILGAFFLATKIRILTLKIRIFFLSQKRAKLESDL
jgi:hypothetical protein